MNDHAALLSDLGYEIKLRAIESKRRLGESRRPEHRSIQFGRLLAYSEVLTVMQQSAEAFGIPLTELRIDDIDPNSDLL